MSSSRSKTKPPSGFAQGPAGHDAAALRDKKSGVFSSNKQKQKPKPADPTNTELAKLLGNRTRALLTFEDANFDVDAFISTYCGSLSETAIDNARQDLGTLLATATEEIESVVEQHHQRFLQACAGVEALEDQVALLRNYANGFTALIASLKSSRKSTGGGASRNSTPKAWQQQQSAFSPAQEETGSSLVQQMEADMELLLQELDLAAAGRDLESAITWLAVAESVGAVLDRDTSGLLLEVEDFPGWRHSYDLAVGLRKQRLVAALQHQLSDANASTAEIRATTAALASLVGQATALQAMLHCYSHKIQLSQGLLLKQHTTGSDPDSCEFAGGLVQRTLLEVSHAADDLVQIFGLAQREPASLFAVWAGREARKCALMLRRHVLSTAAGASTGLHTTAQVVGLVLVLCAMLEQSHSISLTAIMAAELYPSVDSAVRRHFKRLTEELRMAATEEVNSLVLATVRGGGAGSNLGSSGIAQVTVSGLLVVATLCKEVASLSELLAPIATPKLATTFKKALLDLFHAATQSISFALKSHMEASAEDAAALSMLLPAIMEQLAGLIEEQLIDAVAPFAAQAGQCLDVQAMDKALNTMYRECQASARAARAVVKQQRASSSATAAAPGAEPAATLHDLS